MDSSSEADRLEAAVGWAVTNERMEFELTQASGTAWDEGRDLPAAIKQAEAALAAIRRAFRLGDG
jgi:hypothetical protein